MPMELPRPKHMGRAMRRGFMRRCPNCGKGHLFTGLLKLTDHCSVCGEHLSHIRADDIPAYFTILIVGHVVVPLMLLAVQNDVPDWLSISIFIPMTIIMTVGLLPSIKGTVAAHLWALRMDKGAP